MTTFKTVKLPKYHRIASKKPHFEVQRESIKLLDSYCSFLATAIKNIWPEEKIHQVFIVLEVSKNSFDISWTHIGQLRTHILFENLWCKHGVKNI